jgi:hypothetical protein
MLRNPDRIPSEPVIECCRNADRISPEYALSLVVRSSEGVLRRARNLCLSALLEAVRDRTKTVDLKQVNRVLLQPHWRKEADLPH